MRWFGWFRKKEEPRTRTCYACGHIVDARRTNYVIIETAIKLNVSFCIENPDGSPMFTKVYYCEEHMPKYKVEASAVVLGLPNSFTAPRFFRIIPKVPAIPEFLREVDFEGNDILVHEIIVPPMPEYID